MQRERLVSLAELQPALRIVPGQKIAYVTDVAWHQDNAKHIVELAHGADLLYIEAVFLERDAEHGQRKFHLTARQAGEIARAAHAGSVIPMHFSPRYVGRGQGIAACRSRGGIWRRFNDRFPVNYYTDRSSAACQKWTFLNSDKYEKNYA